MVEQPAAESTFIRSPSRRDQRQACSKDLQGSRNPFHKISTELVATGRLIAAADFNLMLQVFFLSKSRGAIL